MCGLSVFLVGNEKLPQICTDLREFDGKKPVWFLATCLRQLKGIDDKDRHLSPADGLVRPEGAVWVATGQAGGAQGFDPV